MRRRRDWHHRRHEARVIEQAIQHVLRHPAVECDPADVEPKQIPVECHALVRAGHSHCRMGKAEEQFVGGRLLP